MKWTNLLIMLALIGSASAQRLVSVEGSSSDGRMICPSTPFWTPLNNEVTCGQLVLITSPEDGSTWYWTIPSVNINVTASTYGFTAANCQYRINDGLWNPILNCGVGENSTYEDIVTMPEGLNTLTLNITDVVCGSILNSTGFTVVYPHRGGVMSKSLLVLIVGVPLWIILYRRRKRPL
jgi:hypothetical protein